MHFQKMFLARNHGLVPPNSSLIYSISIIYFFLTAEFEKFSNLEELYLTGNEIMDFITLEGMRL